MEIFNNILVILKGITILLYFIFGPIFMCVAFQEGITKYYWFFLLGLYMFLASIYVFYKTFKKIKHHEQSK